MILWLTLFLLIVGISFILALRSMKEFHEIPRKSQADYGLFLIRQIKNLDARLLDSLRQLLIAEEAIVSLERLFKGRQAALTIFGPKNILAKFQTELDILELEDYTAGFRENEMVVWEIEAGEIFKLNPPQLEAEEQFFWQVILAGKNQVQIRAAVLSKDPMRRVMLASAQNLKAVSNKQMVDFFKSRGLRKISNGLVLDSEEVIRLLKI